jgi:hypothetical protein
MNLWLLFHFHVKNLPILMFLGLILCKILCRAQKNILYGVWSPIESLWSPKTEFVSHEIIIELVFFIRKKQPTKNCFKSTSKWKSYDKFCFEFIASKTFLEDKLKYLNKFLNFATASPHHARVLEILTNRESSTTYLPNDKQTILQEIDISKNYIVLLMLKMRSLNINFLNLNVFIDSF